MEHKFESIAKCPILLYTHFKQRVDNDMKNSTTCEKFESDIKSLIENGYNILPIRKVYDCINGISDCPKKVCCVAFLGGFYSNYELAYPIIKKYNIQVSIFLPPELIGATSHSFYEHFIPHFGISEASEMQNSNLVSLYGCWHNIYERKNQTFDQCLELIEDKLSEVENYEKFAFFIDDFKPFQITKLLSFGYKCIVTKYSNLCLYNLNRGCIGYISVNHKVDALDAIRIFTSHCTTVFTREKLVETADDAIQYISSGKNSVSLTVCENIIVKNYLRHAFPLSALFAINTKKAEKFVLNEYINVVFKPMYNLFDYHNYSYYSYDYFICCALSRDIIYKNNINIVEYIINSLEMSLYCDIWLDTYYIPGKDSYKKFHSNHGLLIYAYNNDTDSFDALSFLYDGTYGKIVIPAKCIMQACSTNYFTHIRVFNDNPSLIPEYDLSYLKVELENYMFSLVSNDKVKYNKSDDQDLFNLKASEYFPTYLQKTAERNHSIHLVCIYGFVEHKKCMMWRLNYICDVEKWNFNIIKDAAVEINKLSKLIINMSIKYNVSHSDALLKKIVIIVQKMVVLEKESIAHILNAINSNLRGINESY